MKLQCSKNLFFPYQDVAQISSIDFVNINVILLCIVASTCSLLNILLLSLGFDSDHSSLNNLYMNDIYLHSSDSINWFVVLDNLSCFIFAL